MTNYEDEKVYGTLCNGDIEIRSITLKYLEEALDVLNDSFFINENVCKATEINLPESLQARLDLRELCRIVANDGVSLMAVYKPTNKVVAVSFNKLQFNDDSIDDSFFVEFKNNQCKSLNAKALMEYMITMDEQIDVFKMYQINCLLEIMFLATLPQFEKNKIGYTLCKYSIDLAKYLSIGQLNNHHNIHPNLINKRPKAVTSLFTSKYSQKIGEKLNFHVLNSVPYTKFTFNGQTFAQRIGPEHPDSVQVCIKL